MKTTLLANVTYETSENGELISLRIGPAIKKKTYRSAQPTPKVFEVTSDEYLIAKTLLDRITDNNPKCQRPDLNKWSQTVRSILHLDKRSFNDVMKLIEWCQSDPFWRGVILSPDSLRKHFDKMWIKYQEKLTPIKPTVPGPVVGKDGLTAVERAKRSFI